MSPQMDKHPRDRFLTVVGRKPVIEALEQRHLSFGELLIDRRLKKETVRDIIEAARQAEVKPTFCDIKKVNRRSRSPKQDQGVALDIETPNVTQLTDWTRLDKNGVVFMPDGVTTPGNVGMIIRSLAAAGLSALVLPERNTPRLSPLMIKASAGTAFYCEILKASDTPSALQVLKAAGWHICALDAGGGSQLFTMKIPPRTVWVFGNETQGISPEASEYVDEWVSIPMAANVESLNVAMSATVVAFENVRRQVSSVGTT